MTTPNAGENVKQWELSFTAGGKARMGLPGWSTLKNLLASAGEAGSIPESGRS